MEGKKKRVLGTIAVTAIALGVLAPTSQSEVSAAKIKLSKKNLTLYMGQTKKLKVKGTKKKVKWSSAKKKVASVNKKGVVTAKRQGTAKITAKVGKKKYTCKVNVVSNVWNAASEPDIKKMTKKEVAFLPKAVKYRENGDVNLELFVVNNTDNAKIIRLYDTRLTLTIDHKKTFIKNYAMPDMDVDIPKKEYRVITMPIKKKYLKTKNFAFKTGGQYYLWLEYQYKYISKN